MPVPEAHLSCLAIGLALDVVWPPRLRLDALRRVGWPLLGLGVVLVGAATRAAGRVDLTRPTSLVTTGPYAVSRHPMYVAWTLLYSGIAFVRGSAWLLTLLPVLLGVVHREARREEAQLRETFGAAFDAYRSRVRRYV